MAKLPPLTPADYADLQGILDSGDAAAMLRALLLEQRRTNLYQAKIAPDTLDWAIFPPNGGFYPVLAGKTVFDLEAGNVTFPDNTSALLPTALKNIELIQSMVFATDAPVSVTIDPSGQGTFTTDVSYIIHGTARHARYVTLSAPWPYLLIVVFASAMQPPLIIPNNLGMARYTDWTVTDPNGYKNLPFAAVATGVAVPASAIAAGVSTVPTVATSQKTWVVRNLGPGTAQVRVQGTGYGLFGDTLDAAVGAGVGWVLDTDIHAPGGPNAQNVSVAASSQAILESGIDWAFVRMNARPTTSVGCRLIVELQTNVVGLR